MKPPFPSHRIFLIVILITSFLVRWALVLQGGQLFNPDEYRYLTSRVIAREIQKGRYQNAIIEATRKADHLGFKLMGIVPALMEVKRDKDINSKTATIPGLFFSFFSWINILIVWFLALRLGADKKEAVWAAFLASTSTALFYYSSHLYPYDLSITFGLLALYVGLRENPGVWRSILTGFLGFLTFFTYNGYWTLTGFAFIVHVLSPFSFKLHRQFFIKVIFTSLGFIVPFTLLLWLSNLVGNNLWNDYVSFSQTIINGTYSEGAAIPFKYLWASEHFNLIIWLVLIAFAVMYLRKGQPQRIVVWLAGIFFIYGCLAVSSVVLHKFVVYGRLARQLVPFIALAGAFSLHTIGNEKRYGRSILAVTLMVIIFQAGVNFRVPLQLIYPLDFLEEAQSRYPDFDPPKNLTYYYTPNVMDIGSYRTYFVQFVTPVPKKIPLTEGTILMSAENPLSAFPPFHYDEWYSPEERSAFPTINMVITKIK